jgi:hypothetical protein
VTEPDVKLHEALRGAKGRPDLGRTVGIKTDVVITSIRWWKSESTILLPQLRTGPRMKLKV